MPEIQGCHRRPLNMIHKLMKTGHADEYSTQIGINLAIDSKLIPMCW